MLQRIEQHKTPQYRENPNQNVWRGFGLVEVLVYVAILIVLSAVAVETLLTVHTVLAEIRVTRVLNASAATSLEQLLRVLRDAKSINTGGSVLGISPGVLSLFGSEAPPLAHRFSLVGGTLYYERGTEPAFALTPPGVVVTSLLFRSMTMGSTSEAARVELEFSASSGRATTTQRFFGTAVLRNSYAP